MLLQKLEYTTSHGYLQKINFEMGWVDGWGWGSMVVHWYVLQDLKVYGSNLDQDLTFIKLKIYTILSIERQDNRNSEI